MCLDAFHVQLDAESRARGQHKPSLFNAQGFVDDLISPVDSCDELHGRWIWNRGLQMCRRKNADGPLGIVERDGDVERVGNGGNLLRFGEPLFFEDVTCICINHNFVDFGYGQQRVQNPAK